MKSPDIMTCCSSRSVFVLSSLGSDYGGTPSALPPSTPSTIMTTELDWAETGYISLSLTTIPGSGCTKIDWQWWPSVALSGPLFPVNPCYTEALLSLSSHVWPSSSPSALQWLWLVDQITCSPELSPHWPDSLSWRDNFASVNMDNATHTVNS